jgi:hypothetical protein
MQGEPEEPPWPLDAEDVAVAEEVLLSNSGWKKVGVRFRLVPQLVDTPGPEGGEH